MKTEVKLRWDSKTLNKDDKGVIDGYISEDDTIYAIVISKNEFHKVPLSSLKIYHSCCEAPKNQL